MRNEKKDEKIVVSKKAVASILGVFTACGLCYLLGRKTMNVEFKKGLTALCCIDPTLEAHILETGRKIGIDVAKK